jgi:hypothetical protein
VPTRISFTDPDALTKRSDLTTVRLATGEPGWEDGAIVPTDHWQPTSRTDATSLQADSHTPPSTLVEIVRVPIDVTATHAIVAESPGRIEPFGTPRPGEFVGYADQGPGERTTTIDWSTDLRIGIHVDNFDKLSFADRTTGRRRLGVNLGPGPRWLLLATIDVLDLCRTINRDRPQSYPHTDDVRRYTSEGHELQLLRIRLDPGEGYIAPTELLPHDGSTLDATERSRIAFWLGHWPPGALTTLI